MKKKALIFGISGQDGAYLAELLLNNNYEVFGTSRDSELSNFSGLHRLNIYNKVTLFSVSLIDFRSVMQTILEVSPDEIYNLAGQTSVGLSFIQPVETFESIGIGTLNILEVMRFYKLKCKFYNACSSECFGDTHGINANEETPFKPKSPYAVAKATAFWQVANYREAYNLFVCSGILFNHESPLRPQRFVTKKIIDTVCRISKGSKEMLTLGNIKIERDWGWASEYVNGMHLMLQLEHPVDLVIATGESISLEQFVEKAFDYFKLDYKNYLEFSPSLIRASEIAHSSADPSKALKVLGWQATIKVDQVIEKLIQAKLLEG